MTYRAPSGGTKAKPIGHCTVKIGNEVRGQHAARVPPLHSNGGTRAVMRIRRGYGAYGAAHAARKVP